MFIGSQMVVGASIIFLEILRPSGLAELVANIVHLTMSCQHCEDCGQCPTTFIMRVFAEQG